MMYENTIHVMQMKKQVGEGAGTEAPAGIFYARHKKHPLGILFGHTYICRQQAINIFTTTRFHTLEQLAAMRGLPLGEVWSTPHFLT